MCTRWQIYLHNVLNTITLNHWFLLGVETWGHHTLWQPKIDDVDLPFTINIQTYWQLQSMWKWRHELATIINRIICFLVFSLLSCKGSFMLKVEYSIMMMQRESKLGISSKEHNIFFKNEREDKLGTISKNLT